VDQSLAKFFQEELRLIAARRAAAGCGEGSDRTVGLAFSGGGIRSATFGLGVLQAFEERGLTRQVDYLSTVSGGGFLGGAYSVWRYRQVQHARAGADGACPGARNAPPAGLLGLVPHLRKFSRYLSPRLGLLEAEPWRIVGTFVRNLAIHWLVLVSAMFVLFAALLLSLRHMYATSFGVLAVGLVLVAAGLVREWQARRCMLDPQRAPDRPCPAAQHLLQAPRLRLFTGLALCGLSVAFFFVSTTRAGFPELAPLKEFFAGGNGVAVAMGQVSGWLGPLLYRLLGIGEGQDLAYGLAAVTSLLVGAAAVITLIGFVSEWRWRPRRLFLPNLRWLGLLLMAALYYLLWLGLANHNDAIVKSWVSTPLSLGELLVFITAGSMHAWSWVWQVAFAIFVFSIMISLVIAVFNREMDREEREWSTRLVSVALLTGFMWLAVAGLLLLSTWLAVAVYEMRQQDLGLSAGAAGLTAAGAWIGLSSWAAKLAGSATVQGLARQYWKQLLMHAGPPLFLVGLIVLSGFGAASLVIWLGHGSEALWTGDRVWWLLAAALAVFLISGWILDPNEFALHGFYRDRLVRCYLGASNADSPASDSVWNIRTDDVPLSCLGESVAQGAPFPVINTAVNLFGSKDLRVQQRGCDSFVLTPTGCGSWATNYADMPPRLYLGSALAASGAAVSSAMGMATRGASLAALMTVFNVRLGFWFGNPRFGRHLQKRPLFAPTYLFSEALSATNEGRAFVNLSDGGHFDNLGLYELVRRRCKYIIVVDAEADGNYGFASLEQVIRFVRIDFGVNIDLDFPAIAPEKPGERYARRHWIAGTIDYSQSRLGENRDRGLSPLGEPERGILLYIKSSLPGPGQDAHISRDVIGYSLRHRDFPHESTADQFFSEAQFESYRHLGQCIGRKLLAGWDGQELAALFEAELAAAARR
jgi:hypothetical protein